MRFLLIYAPATVLESILPKDFQQSLGGDSSYRDNKENQPWVNPAEKC